MRVASRAPVANSMLAALPRKQYQRLLAGLEVGMVGREGMLGVPLSLGTDVSPVRALVQGAGAAMRMKSARFAEEIQKSPQLQRQVSRYTRALMSQITQTAA